MKRRGFTLIEIILALAILGIVTTGFLSVLSANMNFVSINRMRTAEQFLGQEQIEAEIDIMRDKIADPVEGPLLTYVTLNNVFEPGVNVKVYVLTHTLGTKTLYTLLSDTQPVDLLVPSISSVTTQLRVNSTPVNYAYAKPATNIAGSYILSPVNSDLFLVNTYHWYVSREGFNIPVPHGSIPEMDWGNKYPLFPDDYALLETTTDINLNDVTAYGGRHIVLAVTPAAKSGKIGKTVPSHPIYISGLPLISTEAILHLDASSIDLEDSTQATTESGSTFLEKWLDISSYMKNAYPSNHSRRPKIIENQINGDFAGRFVQFEISKDAVVHHSSLNGETLNIFTITRGDDSAPYWINGSTSLYSNGTKINNDWRLNHVAYLSNSNDITIGNYNIDISEIIVYKGTLTADEVDAISNYLKAKYQPIENVGEISVLHGDEVTLYKDDSFTLPSTLKATMTTGNNLYTPVTWNGTVDTRNLGTFIFTATSTIDPSKHATYKVNVISKIAVTGISIEPTTLLMISGGIAPITLNILPEDAYNKAVTWSSSNSLVASVNESGIVTANGPGTAVITATTVDGGYQATCSVEVWSQLLPSGMVLHLDATAGISTYRDGVSKWSDQSGHSNDFSQGNYNRMPELNEYAALGLPIIDFVSRWSEYMVCDSSKLGSIDFFMDSNQNFSFFLVGSANSSGWSNRAFISQAKKWNSSASFIFGINSSSQFQQVIRGDDSNTSSGNSEINLHESIWNGSDHQYFINGEEKTGHNNIGTKNNQKTDIILGATGNGDYLDGKIAEIIVFDRALSLTERERVENYLEDKWLKIPSIFWRFDTSTENWTAPNDIDGFGYLSGGKISGSISGIDPIIQSSSPLNVNITTTKRVKIKLKNNTNSSMAQLYFTTAANQTMNEAKHKNFAIVPNSDYLEYTIDLSDLTSWNGTLRQLRIDPATNVSSGSFEIDEILIIE